MKVNELISLLEKVENKERIVVMSKDGEGNSFSPISDIAEDAYLAESTWAGERFCEELTPELIKDGFGEGDIHEDAVPALFLWPTN